VPGDVVANDIQTQILSITDLQTREPFAIFIRPVQTRDKSPDVLDRPAGRPDGRRDDRAPASGLGMEPVIDPLTGQPMMQPRGSDDGAASRTDDRGARCSR
jgi:hypothetical protein